MSFYVITLLAMLTNYCICSDVNVGVPRGHLQPLGAHRDPDPVPEFTAENYPTPEEFWKKFVKPSKPAVFRGAAKEFAGYTKWTDEYLAKNYGDLELRLEGRKEKFGRTPYGILGLGRDTMANFISQYHDPDYHGYIVTELPYPMFQEAGVLPFMTCGTFKHRMVEVDLWMNGGNASSILHKDAFNTMNCLVNGTKDWKLIALSEEKNIYKAWESAPAHGGYSKINVKSVDLKKYPKVANVPWQFTRIEKGDCLFLPKGVYHNVLSYGSHNLAIALLFSRFDRYKKRSLDFSDCDNVTKTTLPLSNFIVDWEYPGKGDLSMGNADLENVRMNMIHNTNKAGKFLLKTLIKAVKSIYSEKDKQFSINYATEAYKYLTGGADELTRDMIRNFTKKQLRVAALCYERVHPTNADWHEYNAISPDNVLETMRIYFKKNKGQLTRKQFLKIYVDGLEGSPVFGNRFFDIIAGKGADSVTKKQFKAKQAEALKPYFDRQIEGEEAAAPEEFGRARPEDEDLGDVDEIAEKERSERRKRFAEEGINEDRLEQEVEGDNSSKEGDNTSKEGGKSSKSREESSKVREDSLEEGDEPLEGEDGLAEEGGESSEEGEEPSEEEEDMSDEEEEPTGEEDKDGEEGEDKDAEEGTGKDDDEGTGDNEQKPKEVVGDISNDESKHDEL